ncbi:hypothetical protein DQ04_03321050 [Trypanosoma grayi]|uniref:hypothetical protein n=1 Tax=Trypanosoma grayi TaxID=71804 RepID=UPI0004F4A9E9|nr:hypothetical protein DQ04_03321050 [Trypanosoma grayi]KEG10765.1 hypothetical protein DQ04_03321050 [Trypanosoma grayi]
MTHTTPPSSLAVVCASSSSSSDNGSFPTTCTARCDCRSTFKSMPLPARAHASTASSSPVTPQSRRRCIRSPVSVVSTMSSSWAFTEASHEHTLKDVTLRPLRSNFATRNRHTTSARCLFCCTMQAATGKPECGSSSAASATISPSTFYQEAAFALSLDASLW